MSKAPLSSGQKIELNDGRTGTIRFVGPTSFQTGDWVGVELEEATGKNDGSVQGQRYFTCAPKYGIFCRPSGISQVLEEVREKPKPAGNGPSIRARPSSVHTAVNGAKKTTLQDSAGRRASAITGASPAPVSRLVSGIRSPAKSPTKQLSTNGTSSTATSRTSTPPVSGRTVGAGQAAKSRPSIAPRTAVPGKRTSTLPSTATSATQKTSRSSLAPSASSRGPTSRTTPGTAGIPRSGALARPGSKARLSSNTDDTAQSEGSEHVDTVSQAESTTSSASASAGAGAVQDDEDETIQPSFAPPPMPPIPPEPAERTTRNRRPSSPTSASVHSQRTIRSTAASTRQIEELEAKLRLMERKRMEDRELKQHLEQAQQERDQFKGIIEKLQHKYRPQQQEMEKLKMELAEYEQRFVSIEELQADHDHAMESALLDREVAEETAEGLKADLEILRAKKEEMDLELEILREENSELGKEMSPEERTSAGWLQLEKSNDRLKSALLSLRDLAQDKEAELKEQIGELEREVKDHGTVKTQFEESKEKLSRANADMDDLRQQLEVALGAEDMIESLTEENMNMRDRVTELRGVIEDLESLKELNDELEINHVEAEKQMQEEIDFKDSLLLDREKTAKDQQAALDEADYNISRFRALVSQLQNDLQDLEASKQISETEAADLSSKSRAMLDLNTKLQSSAAKTQVKTIDLELRKLDAQQALEHLEIVKLFLPEAFNIERDSVLALLRFKRIGFKSSLVQGFLKERVASFGTRGQDEDMFAACDAIDKLTWVAAMSDRLVNSVSSSNVNDFTHYGTTLYELEVVERTLNDYVDGLRRNDIRESDMTIRLGRCIEVMTHLAGLHIGDGLADHADALLMKTLCLQSRLESAISALSLTRSAVESHLLTTNDDVEYEDENASDAALILQRLKTIIEHARNAKVVSGKTQRALSDLQARSLTLEATFSEQFEDADVTAHEILSYACQTGASIQELFAEEGRTEPFLPSEVTAVLASLATNVFAIPTAEPGPYSTLVGRLRTLTDVLADLAILPTDLDNTIEFERAPAPWVARANDIQRTKIASVDTEAELARAGESIRERDDLLKVKETELEEQSVRIEMLEARMKDAGKRSAKIGELERKLHDAKESEKKAKIDLAQARQDAQRDLERAREEMARLSDDRKKGGNDRELASDAVGAGARIAMKRQETKIAGLEGAVRFLKEEIHRLRLPPPDAPKAILSSLDWLHDPLQAPKTAHQKQQEALHGQGEKILAEMLALASRPQVVDLTGMPANKLAWRPAKENSRWQVERRNEEWADWKQWRQDVVRQARGLSSGLGARRDRRDGE